MYLSGTNYTAANLKAYYCLLAKRTLKNYVSISTYLIQDTQCGN